uniref:NAD-dependent epimerase/dehydratase family protein n=1 Tax=Algoriphagus sp. TaxID=1872435 RepID=UPI004048A738
MQNKKILVTGAAGFIGFHLIKCLLDLRIQIIGLDNINSYYDANLKYDRLHELGIQKDEIKWNEEVSSIKFSNYKFFRINLEDSNEIIKLCEKEQFTFIIHLAAQAGVRYSLENPSSYIQSNLVGFGNILEAARIFKIQHLIYASSSSVYGMNEKTPFSVNDNVDYPISLYAATKKANELMAYTYSHLYGLPTTGLRFFTVYGPWGRPDMAYFNFVKSILDGQEITLYNYGNMRRDFTFISDIISGILEVLKIESSKLNYELPDLVKCITPYRILNFGNNKPVSLFSFVNTLEEILDKKAIIKLDEIKSGDVIETWADLTLTKELIDFEPKVEILEGLTSFVDWYKWYFIYGRK